MSFEIKREGFTAFWVNDELLGPYVQVTGPGITHPMEFAASGPLADACDLMSCCITYAAAVSMGQQVRQSLTVIRREQRA